MSMIVTETDGPLYKIIFNRPEKKNAFLQEAYRALEAALKEADADDAIAAIVFLAEGEAFSSGNDVADFGPDVVKNLAGDFRNAPVMKFLHTLNNAEKPIVAGVNGLAVGVAVTMLLHCDLVYAAPSASFTIPFTKLGIVPEAASSLLLPRVIGYPKAADMLLRCRMMTAEEADAAGLLSEILHEEDFRSAVLDRAGDLADKAPEALKITKAMMKKNRPEIAERIDYEAEFFLERLHSAEVAEAVAAFFEKRKPDFRKSG